MAQHYCPLLYARSSCWRYGASRNKCKRNVADRRTENYLFQRFYVPGKGEAVNQQRWLAFLYLVVINASPEKYSEMPISETRQLEKPKRHFWNFLKANPNGASSAYSIAWSRMRIMPN